MKAFLLFKDRDFDLKGELPRNGEVLVKDLELSPLFRAMALGDEFLLEVAKKVVLSGLNNDLHTILYRQEILKDGLKNPSVVREIYALAVEAMEVEKKVYWGYWLGKYPSAILSRSIEVLQLYTELLRKLKTIAEEHDDKFGSEGFKRLLGIFKKELTDEYLTEIEDHLKTLKFQEGVLISAELGKGNKGVNYTLRKSLNKKQSWISRIFGKTSSVYTYNLHPRDESGARALSELRDRGVSLVANALAQSADHLLSFFTMLRIELAFYVGCLNLYEQLVKLGGPVSFPIPIVSKEHKHSFKELYDVSLALTMKQRIVGNDMNGDSKNPVIITGANQGGKSTFLRSIGLAQLMMQCGMFVGAKSFSSTLCDALFTHYRREEDPAMKSGKLDEELMRMSEIVDRITPHSIILFNESFAATNEREGSEIARQIVTALAEKGIRVFFVTHLYEFAHEVYKRRIGNSLFMRAEREANGRRTFKLVEGEPLETSYGIDLYNKTFIEKDSDDRFKLKTIERSLTFG